MTRLAAFIASGQMAVAYFYGARANARPGQVFPDFERRTAVSKQGRSGRLLLLDIPVHFLLRCRMLEPRCTLVRQSSPRASTRLTSARLESSFMKRIVLRFALVFSVQSLPGAGNKGFRQGTPEQFAASRRMGRFQIGRSHDQSVRGLSGAQRQGAGRAGHSGDLWLTDWVRSLCDELAENGVIAIAPDLLSGQKFEDVDGARKAISALPKEQVQADLDATSEYALTKIPAATARWPSAVFAGAGDGRSVTRT